MYFSVDADAMSLHITGATLAVCSSVEIPIEDDDPEALSTLCQVLHFRNDSVPRKPDLELILKVAMHVDKYNCAEEFKPSAECWLSHHMKTSDAKILQVLLQVSQFSYTCSIYKLPTPERLSELAERITQSSTSYCISNIN